MARDTYNDKWIGFGGRVIKLYYKALLKDHGDDLFQTVYLTCWRLRTRNSPRGYINSRLNRSLYACARDLGWIKRKVRCEDGKVRESWIKAEIAAGLDLQRRGNRTGQNA